MTKRDFKSTSGEPLSSHAEHFISEIYKSLPCGTSQWGSLISKTPKGNEEKEITVISP